MLVISFLDMSYTMDKRIENIYIGDMIGISFLTMSYTMDKLI